MKHLLLWVALCWGLTACSPPQPFHHTDLSGATFAAEFPRALADQGGQPRRLADFRGRVVILFFGYTSCPDICPTALARFAAVREALGEERQRLQVLFVTLDPERDSPARLGEYVTWFDPSFLGLWSDRETLARTVAEFRITAVRQEVGGGLGYTLDHTAGAYVYDLRGRLRLLIPDNAQVPAVVADLRRLLRED
ncbi:SCO family protein [Azospira sp. I09]|uniref:SCO family protein n=1 Tax=Azospira sp. I09 TaxID=1765049 RepID=UPI001260F604|nr:SCO family protein [Azospira sp. I09]BBN89060.1 photosynthetic protein synthase I [Azospira sp. I09]